MDDKTVPDVHSILRYVLNFLSSTHAAQLSLSDADTSFAALGLCSARAVTMMVELSTYLGRELSPILPWEHSSPGALARHLAGSDDQAQGDVGEAVSPSEPIAIVGMACRFPGASTLDEFWSLLAKGTDCVGEIPSARWDVAAFHHEDNAVADRMATRQGAFLHQVDLFDPAAFGISPREAAELDPQQRLGLELTVEAAEDAGIPIAKLAGRDAGMFWGAMSRDFSEIVQDLRLASPYRGTGAANNMIANRISYVLDTTGPSMVVDTACSSSLVALDLAVNSLLRGQCEMAFVGAVNIILSPLNMVAVSKSLGLAPDGRCKAFSADANGPGRGEGAGVILLKPLSRALRDGDRIYAYVRATAVNNDGRSNGLTAPNGLAQEKVLRRAYRQAGIAAGNVDYVEAHGTGTPLGDPIEIAALGRVLGVGRAAGSVLKVGSVKSNLAHLEAAAGMAGIIKTALMLHKRVLVPSIHAGRLNPLIDFVGAGVSVVREVESWPGKSGRPAFAGVSSFGWGGTNAHAVLEGPASEARLLTVRAESEVALMKALVSLSQGAEPLPAKVGPAEGGWRAGLVVRDRKGLARLLDLRSSGKQHPHLQIGSSAENEQGVVLMCGPAGGQWPGMARQFFAQNAVFRAALKEVGAALAQAGGGDIVADLLGKAQPALFESVEFMVPAVFALQIAQAALVRSWGVPVGAVVGYSIGEIAAACISGQIDLASAARVAVAYGKAAGHIAGQGGLLLVMASRPDVARLVALDEQTLFVAGETSDASLMLAGLPEALEAASARLREAGIMISPIRVPLAAHSPLAESAARLLEMWLPSLKPGKDPIAFYSVVTSALHAGHGLTGAYFAQNLRAPNLLPEVIGQLLSKGHRHFVELGPQPSLIDAVRRIGAGINDVLATGLARMARDEGEVVAEARAALFAAGCPTHSVVQDHLLVLSARHPAGLRELAAKYAQKLEDTPLQELAPALARCREQYPWRLSLVDSHSARAADRLLRYAREGHAAGVEVRHARRQRSVFVFAGQGSQWAGMGASLLSISAAARDMIERLAPVFASEAQGNLWDLLCNAEREEDMVRTDLAQPAIVALQLALCAHLATVGLLPQAVIGHSIGEVTAACIAGAFSPETALAIACRRGRVMQAAESDGRMVSFSCGAEAMREIIRALDLPLDIAAENDRQSCVVGGPSVALEALTPHCVEQGIQAQALRVAFAFHTRYMTVASQDLAAQLADLPMAEPQLPFYSTVTGGLHGGRALDGAHWAAGVRQSVRFADAMAAAINDDFSAFICISPQSVLNDNMAAVGRDQGRTVSSFPTLRRRLDARRSLLELLGQCHVHGLLPDLHALYPEADFCSLPLTPWDHRHCWPDMTDRRDGEQLARMLMPSTEPAAVYGSGAVLATITSLDEVLRGMGRAERVERLQGLLMDEVAVLIGAEVSSLSPEQPFMAMGFDSHMGLGLQSRLQEMLNLELPATLIWNYVDVRKLAAHLGQLLEPNAEVSKPIEGTLPPQAVSAGVDTAPLDTLSQLLDELEAS